MTWLLLGSAICFAAIVVLMVLMITTVSEGKREFSPSKIIFITLGLIISSMLWVASAYELDRADSPQAIDVYRGETKLKTYYLDNVAVDSIVVWKENNEQYKSSWR